jgi:uncharacterized protein
MKYILTLCFLLLLSIVYAQDSKDITFENGSVSLAGTVIYPTGNGPFPAIILVSGSGGQDRNSNLFGFEPFRLIAEHLASQGIAVLRYDDRGTGASTGDSPMTVTSKILATDVQAAVKFLKRDEQIDAEKIGILGHSEGGVIAPMVAVENDSIAFLVLMAGYGVKGMDLTLVQQEAIMKAQGLSEDMVTKAVDTNRKVLALLELNLSEEVMMDSIRAYMIDMYEIFPEELKAQMGQEDFINNQTAAVKNQLASPWTRYFLTYDPAPMLSKVHCPVLLLFGEKDTQVSVAQNAGVMETTLRNAGNDKVELKIYPEANHLFQKAVTGSPAEYQTLPKEFVDGFLTDISQWIQKVTH